MVKVERITRCALILPIRFYQYFISPFLRSSCRFHPSCSNYTLNAIEAYGPIKGLLLGIKRILRCRPGGGFGYDPVLPKEEKI